MPLTVQAQANGRDYLAAVADEAATTERLDAAGQWRHHRARHDQQIARQHTETVRDRLRSEWGSLPASADRLNAWAEHAAAQHVERDPQVTDADDAVTEAKAARQAITERQRRERLALLARLHGPERVRRDPIRYQLIDPHRETARWKTTADQARQEAARLRALPPDQAARQITAKRAEIEAARQAEAERVRRLRTTPEQPAVTRKPRRDGPELGL